MLEGPVSFSVSLWGVPPRPPFSIPTPGPTAYTDAVPGALRFFAGRAPSPPSLPKPHLAKAAAPTPGNAARPTSKTWVRPRDRASGPSAPASVRPSLPLPTRPRS